MTRYIRKHSKTTTIAASGTVSSAIDLGEHTLVAVRIPVTIGTSFTFQVSTDGTTFKNLVDTTETAISITKTAGNDQYVPLDANDFVGFTHVKIVSGSTETSKVTIEAVLYMV